MNTEEALRAHLIANDALAAVVGDGVFPDVVPGADDLPACAYSRTATSVEAYLDGTNGLRTVSFTIACVSLDWPEAKEIARLVDAAFPPGLAALAEGFEVNDVSVENVVDQGKDIESGTFRFDVEIEVRDNRNEGE